MAASETAGGLTLGQPPSASNSPPSYCTTRQKLPKLQTASEHTKSFPDDVQARYRHYQAGRHYSIRLLPTTYKPSAADIEKIARFNSSKEKGDLSLLVRRVYRAGQYWNHSFEIESPCRCCRFVNDDGVSSEVRRPCYDIFDEIFPFLSEIEPERSVVGLLKFRTRELFIGKEECTWDNLCKDGVRDFAAVYLKRLRRKKEEPFYKTGGRVLRRLLGYPPSLKNEFEEVIVDASVCLEDIDLTKYTVYGDIKKVYEEAQPKSQSAKGYIFRRWDDIFLLPPGVKNTDGSDNLGQVKLDQAQPKTVSSK